MWRTLTVLTGLTLAFLLGSPMVPWASETLTIADGSAWNFHGGDWTENQEGVIRPPDLWNLHSRAFYTEKGFSDCTVEFEFNGDYRETGTGSAGLILRASDPNQFYFVYFP